MQPEKLVKPLRLGLGGGTDTVDNDLSLCTLHHKLFDFGAINVTFDYRVRVSPNIGGETARKTTQGLNDVPIHDPREQRFLPQHNYLKYHHTQCFKGSVDP